MKVAVLMPAYNAAAHVEAALDSLLSQESADCLDIIVADDGSSDGTPEKVESLAQRRGQVRLIRTSHGGVSGARNKALAVVSPDTDLVGFLDADDLWPKGRLKKDLACFASVPGLGFTYGAMHVFLSPEWERAQVEDEPKTIEFRGVHLGAGMFSYDLVQRVGLFDEDLEQGEDLDFLLRVLEQRPSFRIFDEPTVLYRRHGNNLTQDKQALHHGLRRVLAKSIRRRRALGAFEYPRGVFDARNAAYLPWSW